jgi:hypothetical protein
MNKRVIIICISTVVILVGVMGSLRYERTHISNDFRIRAQETYAAIQRYSDGDYSKVSEVAAAVDSLRIRAGNAAERNVALVIENHFKRARKVTSGPSPLTSEDWDLYYESLRNAARLNRDLSQ